MLADNSVDEGALACLQMAGGGSVSGEPTLVSSSYKGTPSVTGLRPHGLTSITAQGPAS